MKQFNIIQQEINLLAKQIELVTRLEEQKLICIRHSDVELVNKITEKLNQIYPTYLELREKYLTVETLKK